MPEHPITMKTDHFCAPSISKWYYSQCHRWNVFFVCLFFVFFFPPSSNYQQHMKKHELMHHLVCNGDMKVDWNGASPTILPDFIRNQSEQWWCPCFIAITSWNHHLLTYWYFKIKNKLNSTASLNYVVQIWHKMSGDVARPSWVEPRACGSVKQAQDFHPGDPCACPVLNQKSMLKCFNLHLYVNGCVENLSVEKNMYETRWSCPRSGAEWLRQPITILQDTFKMI